MFSQRPSPFHHHHHPLSSSDNTKHPAKRKHLDRLLSRTISQPNYNIEYETYVINIPNYSFGKPRVLPGSGGRMALAFGKRLSDDRRVFVKISPYIIRLEREYYITQKLHAQPDGNRYIPQVLELVTLTQDGLCALVYSNDDDNEDNDDDNSKDNTPKNSQNDVKPPFIEENCPILDIKCFLTFAIECCSCLQFLHANSIVHGELRPSAFRWITPDKVKIWNFGAGLKSYEDRLLTVFGWRRAMMAAAAAADDEETIDETLLMEKVSGAVLSPSERTRRGLQSSLAYISPEQTGRTSYILDHRTDLYSLGVVLFTTLTGQPPFTGSPMEIIQAALSRGVPLVHSIRKDVPPVISLIIDKMTRKAVDERYSSAHGVKEDFVECLRRLEDNNRPEELVFFPLGVHDISTVFQFPSNILGRDREIEVAKAAVRRVSATHELILGKDGERSREDDVCSTTSTSTSNTSGGHKANTSISQSSSLFDKTGCEVVVITGPGGIGKSTLMKAIHTYARQYGYLGSSKFDSKQKRPYHGLLCCLSSILRQLLTESEAVIHDFYTDLKQQLGPNFSNVRLLVDSVPELKPIIDDNEPLARHEEEMMPEISAESRFHAVFLNVIQIIIRKRSITLCLDDVHEADEPSLHLIASLISSGIKMLIILTYRDSRTLAKCIQDELDDEDNAVRVTNIRLPHLGIDAITLLVSQTLQSTPEIVQPLADIIYHKTHGNPFYAKQLMMMMKRRGDIWLDWEEKEWKYRLDSISEILRQPFKLPPMSVGGLTGDLDDVVDVRHIISHLKDMDPQAQTFLMWASLIGSVFDFQQIKWLMLSTEMFGFDDSSSDLSDSTNQDQMEPIQSPPPCRQLDLLEFAPTEAYLTPPDSSKSEHQAMAGLQAALQEAILEAMADDKYRFSHDRYCQAASMLIADEKEKERMHLRIGQMLMADREANYDKDLDVFLTADHLLKSAQFIKQFRSRSRYRQVLMKAGAEALNSGAPQMAMTYYECAMMLLSHSPWDESCPDVSYRETIDLHMRMAELRWWNNRRDEASRLIDEIMQHSTDRPVDRAQAQRIQARMYFHMQDTDKGIRAIMDALQELGMKDDLPALLPPDCGNPAFKAMKERIEMIGYEALKDRGPCQSRRILTIMTLLNEACTGCYWANPELATDLAIKLVELSIDHGYGPATGNGFVWLGAAACRLGEHELGTLLGETGLAISDKYAGNSEIARSILIHHGMLAQWKNKDHYRESIKYFQQAHKYAIAAGDKMFSAMALVYISAGLLHTGYNLSELQLYLKEIIQEREDEEVKSDEVWILIASLLKIVMAFQGKLPVEDVNSELSGAPICPRRHVRHHCFQILLLVHFDRYKEAADIGFQVVEVALNHPGHHHTSVALFYHTVALIACIRDHLVDDDVLEKYEKQARLNQKTLAEWAERSETNYKMFSMLVDAELSAMNGPSVESSKLYNDAMYYGKRGEWFPFLALAYQCTADYYLRWKLNSIAGPMLQQSLDIYNSWGAWGKARSLCDKYDEHLSNKPTMSKPVNSSTQTDGRESSPSLDSVMILGEDEAVGPEFSHGELYGDEFSGSSEAAILSLDVVDLTSIIKSSQVLSNEVNSFDELLKKMMAIIMSNSAADVGAIIIKEGVFGIAAHSSKNGCETFDPPMPLKDNNNLISTLVVHYVIHTRTILFIPNIMEDTRFATGEWFAQTSEPKSVICMPCVHKNTLVGVLYLEANLNIFTHKQLAVLSILCQVIGISITNALLFKSVQRATQANAKMIASQRKALEEARTSREQALRATKLKSNFLANMSHELRTPFSGFYGMITLLSETRLDPEQREFVTIAKQSCEMLLQIIDDLLDFSKLEARKVKLHYGLFYLEDLIEDRIELLITLASNKNLELVSFVEPETPTMVYGDSNRIGQILMNLIGNAIKFTQQGEVIVSCGLEKDLPADLDPPLSEDEIMLKFAVQDTGIGMSQEEIKSLFLPFSQVDGSTTRNFGGTGLGLSICLGLVRLMGGNIWVKSKVNEGSTFHFRVRVTKASSVAEPGVDSDRRDHEVQLLTKLLGKPRLLVITSERQTNRISALVPNAVIKRVESPEEGLDIAKQYAANDEPFHCLVVDSPSADTMQSLLESIEADTRLRNLHVLLLYAPATEGIRQQITSGKFSRNESQQKLFNARFTRITKPVRRLRLLRILLRVLGIEPKISSPSSEQAGACDASLADINQKTTDGTQEQMDTCDNNSKNNIHGGSPHEQPQHQPQHQPYSSYSSSYQRNIEAFTPEELAIFQGKKILVAEDNPVAQKLIVKQLQRAGFVVEACNNGFECIDTWKMRGPGYFLMAWIDHHMPGCDGTEATKKIRELEKQMNVDRPMPIIALTADAQKTAQQSCLDAGMTDYLVKPLMQKELVAVLRRYCLTPQPITKQSS